MAELGPGAELSKQLLSEGQFASALALTLWKWLIRVAKSAGSAGYNLRVFPGVRHSQVHPWRHRSDCWNSTLACRLRCWHEIGWSSPIDLNYATGQRGGVCTRCEYVISSNRRCTVRTSSRRTFTQAIRGWRKSYWISKYEIELLYARDDRTETGTLANRRSKGDSKSAETNRGTWKANKDGVARATHAAANTRRVSVGRQKTRLRPLALHLLHCDRQQNTVKDARMVELLGKPSSRKSSRCLARSVLRRLARIHREAIDIVSSVKGSNLKKFAVMARLVCVLHIEREVISSSKQRGKIANGHAHSLGEIWIVYSEESAAKRFIFSR